MASRLGFAAGCYWATQVIAFENRLSRVLATGAVLNGKGMVAASALMQLSRRSSTFVVVALFHALLFYLVLHAVTHSNVHDVPPLVNKVLDVPHPAALPRMDDPVWEKPVLHVPPPEAVFPPENDGAKDVIEDALMDSPPQLLDSTPTSTPTSVPPHTPAWVQGGPGAGFPNPDDYYPSLAKRTEEQGSVTLQVCVDARGRLTNAPLTTQSSGSERLDQGALKLAAAASGHYRASTRMVDP